MHWLLLLLTIGSTTLVGASALCTRSSRSFRRSRCRSDGRSFFEGFWYSGTLLGILGAHEMGHYLLCRHYNVDASLPYFIPMPPLSVLTGTLGAVIKIREAFPSRRILFDIGVAGPIAGFVVLVPALFFGMTLSNVVPEPTRGQRSLPGRTAPLQDRVFAIIGPVREGYTINIHPMVFAAWFGMLATALNLLPFGQLDGGHITYATLGRWSVPISIATVGSAIAMTVRQLQLAGHDDHDARDAVHARSSSPARASTNVEPLGGERYAIAVFALIMFDPLLHAGSDSVAGHRRGTDESLITDH